MSKPSPLNDIYKQALASLCKRAGGEMVVVLDEAPGPATLPPHPRRPPTMDDQVECLDLLRDFIVRRAILDTLNTTTTITQEGDDR